MKNINVNYKDKSFIKEVAKRAIPLIIGSIILGLISIIDSVMVGLFQKTNSGELASLSLASKYVTFITIFIAAFSSMYLFLIMQYKGKNKHERVKDTIKILLSGMLIISIVVITIGWIFADEIMHFFQGDNYGDISTSKGIAQDYMKVYMFIIIPTSAINIWFSGISAFSKQKWIIPLVIMSIAINILFNYLFYKTLNIGVNGIAYSSILAEGSVLFVLIIFIFRNKEMRDTLLFNPLNIFNIDSKVLKLGVSRWGMSIQVMIWSSVSLGMRIIYSRWYGDEANQILAIVTPTIGLFYSALDGIATTKGYFVGKEVGAGNKEQAYKNDKRLNMYTFIVASIEGLALASLAYVIPMAWTSTTSHIQWYATISLIAVGLTYPIAAVAKVLLGSFKVAGMGKTIVLSNGLFGLVFELIVPLILFLIYLYTDSLGGFEFWMLFVLTRCIKLVKIPPTVYFWKKLKWLEPAI